MRSTRRRLYVLPPETTARSPAETDSRSALPSFVPSSFRSIDGARSMDQVAVGLAQAVREIGAEAGR